MKLYTIASVIAIMTVIFAATAIGLFTTAAQRHEPARMTPPTLTLPHIYDGSAAAYRLRNGETLAEPPKFEVRLINEKDKKTLRRHLDNLAAQRHWTAAGYAFRNLTYVVPDHDVEILRQLTRDPYEWARQPERESNSYLPQPSHNTLMPAQLVIQVYQPSFNFLMGAVFSAMIATLLAISGAGYYCTEILPHRKRRNAR